MPRLTIQTFEKFLSRARNWDWLRGIVFSDWLRRLTFALVIALSSWAAKAVDFIAVHGWGAVVISGILLACALMLVLSVSAIAWRYFKPLPVQVDSHPAVTPSTTENVDLASHLYVPIPYVDFQHLREDLHIDFTINFFSSYPGTLVIDGIEGNIIFAGLINEPNQVAQNLIPPVFRNVFELTRFQSGESILLLEQRVPRKIAAAMAEALDAGKSVEFKFSVLKVQMRPETTFGSPVKLPLPEGIECILCGPRVLVGKINYAYGGGVFGQVSANG